MADFTDRIKLVFEAVTSDATSGVGKLKSGVGEAEGSFGKLKAAAGGALDMITSSPAAMAGVAVAVGKVALDLATGFEDAALSAQNFATASGLSVEQASRWQEVAGDLGVSTETLAGAVNKMDIAASKGVLDKLGIGGDDTNAKLLNAFAHLNGIQDASERASQGAQIFGKSWATLAPLVAESGDLAANLAAVSDSKVIDEGEVRKAQEMRDAMDKLSDAVDDVKLAAGEALIGPITDIANIVGHVTDGVSGLADATGGLVDVGGVFKSLNIFAGLPDVLDGLSRATDFSAGWQEQLKGVGSALTSNIPVVGGWADSLFGADDAQEKAKESAQRAASAAAVHAQAMKDQAQAADDAAAALDGLLTATLGMFNSNLALASASDKTDEAIAAYATSAAAAEAASWGNADANKEADKSMRGAESAALAQAAAAAKLQEDQAKANDVTWNANDAATAQANSLRTVAGTLAPGSPLRQHLLDYADQIEKVPTSHSTTFDADTSSAAQKIDALSIKIHGLATDLFGTLRAISSASTTSVGGSAVITAPSSATGASTTRALAPVPTLATPVARAAVPSGGGAPIINLSVSVAPFTNPAEVGRAIADYLDAFYRRSGTRARAVA